MRILIDVGHPAHVHYYKNMARELEKRGHIVFWTSKPTPSITNLLDKYGFSYKLLPAKRDGILKKVFFQVIYDLILLSFSLRNRIDIAIGTSVTVAHLSRLSRVKSIVFDDDDDNVQPLVAKYVHPYADALLSPDALSGKRKEKRTLYYPGYHELAYLHPTRFSPETSVLSSLSLKKDSRFFVLRFNVFKAHHDKGAKGLTLEQKMELVGLLKKNGHVFITTERDIEPELSEFQLKIEPDRIHSLVNYCTMFIGDSQTMASESAVLGVPTIRCNTFAGRISYLEEQESRYGLAFSFTPDDFDEMIKKINILLGDPDLRSRWALLRERMLRDKIDVTDFWCWFIENYPDGVDEMKQVPHFFDRFKK